MQRLFALFVAACFLNACSPGPSLMPLPGRAQALCPDVSGDYFFPGQEDGGRVCVERTRGSFSEEGLAFPLPTRSVTEAGASVPDGGWSLIQLATVIRLDQNGCEGIRVTAPVSHRYSDWMRDGVMKTLEAYEGRYRIREEGLFPGDFTVDQWGTAVIPFTTASPDSELTWDETSITYRFRFRAAGFGAGTTRNYLTLTLGKLPDGGLLYRLRHDEVPGADEEVECRLPPAGGAEGPTPVGDAPAP